MPKASTLYSIQYLRALAALAVADVHIGWMNQLWGQQGVDVFFVVSGFIMMHVSRREPRPMQFLRARAIRIIPLYWLVTLAWALAHPATSVRNLLLSLAFVPHFAPAGQDSPVLLQGWTLVFEMFFYASFGTALMLPKRLMLPALTVFMATLAILGVIARPTSATGLVYLSPLLLEFLAGAWLQKAWGNGLLGSPVLGFAMLIVGLASIIAVRNVSPGAWRFIAWGVPPY